VEDPYVPNNFHYDFHIAALDTDTGQVWSETASIKGAEGGTIWQRG